MNWFQRYGIPGAYFVTLSAAWLFALLSPQAREILDKDLCPSVLVALAALIFIPVGYIISILAQWVYLKCKCLGVHRAAVRRADVRFPNHRDCEPWLEAHTLLLTTLLDRIPLHHSSFIRDWVARRTDVMAINGSLIMATFLAPVVLAIGLCPELSLRCTIGVVIGPILVSLAVLAVTCLSYLVLREQVIEVITGVYRRFR